MKILISSLLITSVFFLVIDIIWLSFSVKHFYRPNLGTLLNDKPVLWAAALFYFIYVISLAILVLMPSINNNSISQAFWTGIVFGIVTYGTYNLTNMATIKNWSSNVVIVDMIWGGILTGVSSTIGIYLSKKLIL